MSSLLLLILPLFLLLLLLLLLMLLLLLLLHIMGQPVAADHGGGADCKDAAAACEGEGEQHSATPNPKSKVLTFSLHATPGESPQLAACPSLH